MSHPEMVDFGPFCPDRLSSFLSVFPQPRPSAGNQADGMSQVYVEHESIGDQGTANTKRSPSNAYRTGSARLYIPATGFSCGMGRFRHTYGHDFVRISATPFAPRQSRCDAPAPVGQTTGDVTEVRSKRIALVSLTPMVSDSDQESEFRRQ